MFFALIITIVMFATCILWCIERFFIAPHNNNKKKTCSKSSNSLIAIFTSRFTVLLVVFIIRSFVFEPFKIPSGSMMPTLLVGDFIIVEKFSYGIKNPITKNTIMKIGSPKRGDIAVFKYSKNTRITYIKRVIGLPGDRISYDPITKQLKVRARKYHDFYFPIVYSDYKKYNLTKNYDSGGILIEKRKESLGGAVHEILTIPNQQDRVEIYYKKYPYDQLAEWVVPQGEYFLMGDNRDNSYDSRYCGFVSEKNIMGKAKVIWLSFDKKTGIFRTCIRFSRIGFLLS